MKNDDWLIDKFRAAMRRADTDNSRLEFGFETRVLARIRAARNRPSLLQLAGKFCLASFCAALLLGIYLPVQVEAFETKRLAEAITGDDSADIFIVGGDAL